MLKSKSAFFRSITLISALACMLAISACSAHAIDAEAIIEEINPARNYLIVVNDDNPYEFGGEYDALLQDDLVNLPDVYGIVTPLEKATARAFIELRNYLATKGMHIGLYSGYRTEAEQQEVYDYYGSLNGWADTNKVSKPGYSEHHTGLLVNVVIWYQGKEDAAPQWYTETAERQETIDYFKQFHAVLADFGFIDRYPAGKEAITGVPCEPYEIRFVGSPELAHAIMDYGYTLEEFLQK